MHESEIRDYQNRISRIHCFLRNVLVDLEEGDKDQLEIADDIHEAIGEERVNGTESSDD